METVPVPIVEPDQTAIFETYLRYAAYRKIGREMSDKKTIIVLVDDDTAVRRALKFSLELDGFEVYACESGEDLLGHAALRACDCIVLDYMMPGMDGLEVLDKLAVAKIAAPVIFITGPVTKGLRESAMRRGARLVMEKPLLDRSLSQRIYELTA